MKQQYFARLMLVSLSVAALAACSQEKSDDPIALVHQPGYSQKVASISDDDIARLNGFSTLADRDPPRIPEYPERLYNNRYTGVTDALGPLVVQEAWSKQRASDGRDYMMASWDAEADVKPWSGWFYPFGEPTLYRMSAASDGLAPLQKYDLITGRRSAAYEEREGGRSAYKGWEGHCDALALAAIMEREPSLPISRTGTNGRPVDLDVADQKALLLKLYLHDNVTVVEDFERGNSKGRPDGQLTMFGQRYNGEDPRQAKHEDIYPEQFQRFIQFEMRENRRPFIFDWDPGSQVWNVAAAKVHADMRWEKRRIRTSNGEMEVTVIATTASVYTANYKQADERRSRESLNQRTATPRVFEYKYDLVVAEERNGRARIAFGIWHGDEANTSDDTVTNHPDSIIAMPKRIRFKDINPEIRGDEAMRILGRTLPY